MYVGAAAVAVFIPVGAHSQSIQYCPAHIEIGAQATGVVTRESPALRGRDLTEGYLTQPMVMVMARLWKDALELRSALDFEGITLKRGELNAGIHGEGYAEVAHIRFSPTLRPSAFDPTQFYGASRIWSISLGAKLALGMSHMRMGRYGVAITEERGRKMDGMDTHGVHDQGAGASATNTKR